MNRWLLATATGGLILSSLSVQAAPDRIELLADRGDDRVLVRDDDDRAARHVRGGRHEDRRGHGRYDGHDNRHDNRRHDRRGGRDGHRRNGYRFEGREHGRYKRHGHHAGRAVAEARRYAEAAVQQAREARRLGLHPDHPRWSLSFNRHFEWALRADDWKRQRELRRRAHALRDLRQYAYGHARRHAPYRH